MSEANVPAARLWSAAEAHDFMKSLRTQLHAAGVFSGDARGYVRRGLVIVGLSVLTWLGLLLVTEDWMRGLVALLAGYTGVQAAAIAHEAGHGAVSRSRPRSVLVGQVFLSLLVGSSYSAWVARHGAHHLHPNSRHDPDVRPWLFSFNETDARAASGFAGWCTRWQHWLLFPLSTLMGFTIKLTGWLHVLRAPGRHPVDLLLLAIHLAVWIALPAWWIGLPDALFGYLLLTWFEGAYLSFVFIANHLGGPTGEEAQHWPPALRQIVTARNLPAGAWLSHLCIGLNTHIEHHLFGHLPATRLAEARDITRRMCLEHKIPYRQCSVVQAFAEVHRCNREMARIARAAAKSRTGLQRPAA